MISTCQCLFKEYTLDSANPIDALVDAFPRLFQRQFSRAFWFIPVGWLKLSNQLFLDLDRMLDDREAAQFEVRQIKEKMCRLRVHFWIGPPCAGNDETLHQPWALLRQRILDRIRAAGDESEATCQRRGACCNSSPSRFL